jgi:hypothetical protein
VFPNFAPRPDPQSPVNVAVPPVAHRSAGLSELYDASTVVNSGNHSLEHAMDVAYEYYAYNMIIGRRPYTMCLCGIPFCISCQL